jgi:hypothetical protein
VHAASADSRPTNVATLNNELFIRLSCDSTDSLGGRMQRSCHEVRRLEKCGFPAAAALSRGVLTCCGGAACLRGVGQMRVPFSILGNRRERGTEARVVD